MSVDEDGVAEGWEGDYEALRERFVLDGEGFVLECGTRVERAGLSGLPPAVQLYARARFEMGAEVEVYTRGLGEPVEKRSGRHVELRTADELLHTLMELQAKYRLTAAWATDGTRQKVEAEAADGSATSKLVVARAGVRFDGRKVGGLMEDEPEGEDNYLAEAAALSDALKSEQAGSRLVIVLDATSPVRAMLRFGRVHDRAKAGYVARDILDGIAAACERHEVVVFLWQRSHTGAPPNEWADAEADAAAKGGDPCPVVRTARSYASAVYAEAPRSLRAWATERAAAVVRAGHVARVEHTQLRQEADLKLPAVGGELFELQENVRSGRCVFADRRVFSGAAAEFADGLGCPFGCSSATRAQSIATSTWWHFQFECAGAPIVKAREAWREAVDKVSEVLLPKGHEEWTVLAGVLGAGYDAGSTSGAWGDVLGGTSGFAVRADAKLRRAVGGLLSPTGDPATDRNAGFLAEAGEARRKGLEVQRAAAAETAELHEKVRKFAAGRRVAKPLAVAWRRRTREAMPGRVIALRRLESTVGQVAAEVRTVAGSGAEWSEDTFLEMWEGVSEAISQLGEEARERWPRRAGGRASRMEAMQRTAAWMEAWRLAAAVRVWAQRGRPSPLAVRRTQGARVLRALREAARAKCVSRLIMLCTCTCMCMCM